MGGDVYEFGQEDMVRGSGYISSAVIAGRNTSLKSNKVILVDLIIIMLIYCFKLFLFNSYANNFLLFFILFYIGLEKE